MTSAKKSNLDLEIGGLLSESGLAGRRVGSSTIYKPGNIRQEGRFIVWDSLNRSAETGGKSEVTPAPAMLDHFRALAHSSDPSDVLRFARRWSVLALMPGRVGNIQDTMRGLYLGGRCYVPGVAHWSEYTRDPVEAYFELARLFDGWMGVYARSIAGGKPTDADFAAINENVFPLMQTLAVSDSWRGVHQRLARILDKLLAVSGARYGLAVIGNRIEARAHFAAEHELLGALTVQLIPFMTKASGLYHCSGCTEAYLRSERAPRAGEANYCPKCKAAKVPARLRKRRQRGKHGEA